MPPAQLTDRLLEIFRDAPRMGMHPVAAVLQPADPLPLVAPDPGMHALPRHPISPGHLRYRDTRADFQDGPVSLLGHAQLPQHERECQVSTEANVSSINVSSIKRDKTCLPGVSVHVHGSGVWGN